METQNTPKARINRIAGCNYSYLGWNGKKVLLYHERTMSPLIGSTECEIRQDPTGYNIETIKRDFQKKNKTRKDLGACYLTITEIEVLFVGMNPVSWK